MEFRSIVRSQLREITIGAYKNHLSPWICGENETKNLISCAFDVTFNLLPRRLGFFGQRVGTRGDSGLMDAIFTEAAGFPCLVCILTRSERSDNLVPRAFLHRGEGAREKTLVSADHMIFKNPEKLGEINVF